MGEYEQDDARNVPEMDLLLFAYAVSSRVGTLSSFSERARVYFGGCMWLSSLQSDKMLMQIFKVCCRCVFCGHLTDAVRREDVKVDGTFDHGK